MVFFQGAEERVRNSRGRRAISVRATVVLLYEGLKIIFALVPCIQRQCSVVYLSTVKPAYVVIFSMSLDPKHSANEPVLRGHLS